VDAGGSVNINVYLEETVSGGSLSLLATENGLYSAQLTVNREAPPPTDAASIAGFSINPAFNDTNLPPGPPAPDVTFTDSQLNGLLLVNFFDGSGPPGVVDPINSNIRRVHLLTLNVQTEAVQGVTTKFTVLDDPTAFLTSTFFFTSLDQNPPYGIGPWPFEVSTAIPEPSTVAMLLSLGGVCGGIFVLRRRRKAVREQDQA
jgi:hypothetical protein